MASESDLFPTNDTQEAKNNVRWATNNVEKAGELGASRYANPLVESNDEDAE